MYHSDAADYDWGLLYKDRLVTNNCHMMSSPGDPLSERSRATVNAVLDIFKKNLARTDPYDKKVRLRGKPFCMKCLAAILGIPRSTMYRYRKDFREGVEFREHGNVGNMSRDRTLSSVAAMKWLKRVFAELGDYCPTTGVRWMPPGRRGRILIYIYYYCCTIQERVVTIWRSATLPSSCTVCPR